MSRNFENELAGFINDIIGLSMAAAVVGADKTRNIAKDVNQQVKNTANKVKNTARSYTNTRQPKMSDFIDHIVSQDTATIIFWADGTKTSVKSCTALGDEYDYEKGLAMAMLKGLFGNNYYREMQALMEKYPHVELPKKEKKAVKEEKKTAEVEDKKITKEDLVTKKRGRKTESK